MWLAVVVVVMVIDVMSQKRIVIISPLARNLAIDFHDGNEMRNQTEISSYISNFFPL